jgi:hypothetical protein
MDWIAKFRRFKSSQYGGLSDEVKDSAYNHWVVLAVRAGVEFTEIHFFHQNMSSGPRRPHAVSKTLGSHKH